MPQRFVICTDSSGDPDEALTVKERNAITRLLEAKGWRVWHWFEDLWLVVNSGNVTLSANELREQISSKFAEERNVLVLEVEPHDHAGMGPKRGWTWMDKYWK